MYTVGSHSLFITNEDKISPLDKIKKSKQKAGIMKTKSRNNQCVIPLYKGIVEKASIGGDEVNPKGEKLLDGSRAESQAGTLASNYQV